MTPKTRRRTSTLSSSLLFPLAVLWNRNYFLRFRFRFLLLKSYGSGSDFLTSYGTGSGFTRQKITVPTVPVLQHCPLGWRRPRFEPGPRGGGEIYPLRYLLGPPKTAPSYRYLHSTSFYSIIVLNPRTESETNFYTKTIKIKLKDLLILQASPVLFSTVLSWIY